MPSFVQWLPWAAPGLYLAGALLAAIFRAAAWPIAAVFTRAALAVALIGCGLAAPAGSPGAGSLLVWVVTVLIAFLGWIIGDYSRTYLRGEQGQVRFVVAFLATLAGVSAVAASANLAVLVIAWCASSAGLHHLLTFYRERPAALLVAHKKFLASRLAEACMVLACALLYRQWQTLDLAAIDAHATASGALPWAANVAASLIAVAVLLKCAQLPVHGWLIQVMEAPTPVSALLHAGVVNLGGYVLIRLAPLMSASPPAQGFLVVVGGATAALAGLVMLTRVTVKVRLAWSTCSQMGLMVLECGLGLYDLALLHLLAHALYKAYAFLTTGEAVKHAIAQRMLLDPREGRHRSWATSIGAVALAGAVVALSCAAWRTMLPAASPPTIALLLLAFGLATLLWSPGAGWRSAVWNILAMVGATQAYLGWHWLLDERIRAPHYPGSPLLSAGTIAVFMALYVAQAAILGARSNVLRKRAYDWVYAGFYLDERFTRLTFRVWPPRVAMPKTDRAGDPQPLPRERLA